MRSPKCCSSAEVAKMDFVLRKILFIYYQRKQFVDWSLQEIIYPYFSMLSPKCYLGTYRGESRFVPE